VTVAVLTPAELVRFRAGFQQGPGCWEWTGETNNKGYGRYTIYRNGKRVRLLTHRLALTLKLGREPVGGTRHRCDNPPCGRPDHLLEGSQRANLHDAIARGRFNVTGLAAGREAQSKRFNERAATRLASGEKACNRCGETKPLGAFSRHRKKLDGRQGECKSCIAERERRRRTA
jgi:hypothetical protein